MLSWYCITICCTRLRGLRIAFRLIGRLAIPVVLALLPALAAGQPGLTQYGYRVINTFPHDIGFFTQGLLYLDGFVYEGTGKNGQSSLNKVDLETGEVLQSRSLSSRYFGEGIEVVGDRIFQLTWRSHMVFEYDLETFEPMGSHYNPTEGWGLAYDGETLILSDGSATLRFIDPANFTDLRTIQVTLEGRPVTQLNELEFINGEIWANVWQTDYILRINPENGVVTGLVDLTGLSGLTRLGSSEAVLNGIAWDSESQRLLVTGKHWANLFEIELEEK